MMHVITLADARLLGPSLAKIRGAGASRRPAAPGTVAALLAGHAAETARTATLSADATALAADRAEAPQARATAQHGPEGGEGTPDPFGAFHEVDPLRSRRPRDPQVSRGPKTSLPLPLEGCRHDV